MPRSADYYRNPTLGNTQIIKTGLVGPLIVIVTTVVLNQPADAQPIPGGASTSARIPKGVKAHRDLAYVANGRERQKLDLFVPEHADGPLPVIIWIHGGGWQNGRRSMSAGIWIKRAVCRRYGIPLGQPIS